MPGILEVKGAKQHYLGGCAASIGNEISERVSERARAISCLGMTELR